MIQKGLPRSSSVNIIQGNPIDQNSSRFRLLEPRRESTPAPQIYNDMTENSSENYTNRFDLSMIVEKLLMKKVNNDPKNDEIDELNSRTRSFEKRLMALETSHAGLQV